MRAPRTKAQKQFTIAARAQFNLQKALERLDYEEEVILPGLEKIAELEKKGDVTLNLNLKPLEIEA